MRRILFVSALLLTACPKAGDPDAPTWYQDVAPLVAENCQGCHAPGKIAPFDLVTYDDAKNIADWLAETVEAKIMPPWAAHDTDECAPPLPWKDDTRLTDAEIATFRAWAEGGALEGDAATAAPLPQPIDTTLDRVDKTLIPEIGFQVPVQGPDQFRCMVLDPGNDETMWLTGLQVNPDNTNVVHHVLVFSSDGDDGDFLDAEAALGGGTFECSAGNPAPHGVELVAAWAPGALPMRVPSSTGMRIDGGARLVMQIHYHPSGEQEAVDKTGIELKWEEDSPGRRAFLALVGNEGSAPELQPGMNDSGAEPEFFIPAGATGHVETIIYEQLDTADLGDLAIFAVGTHMHWVGTDMQIILKHADGTEECLVQTPKWDFNWQRWYDYDGAPEELPVIKVGDGLMLRCTYDNSLNNPKVREALTAAGLDEPQDVRLGDSTMDEMCLGVFGIYVR